MLKHLAHIDAAQTPKEQKMKTFHRIRAIAEAACLGKNK
jgi:hypothetical protein